MGFILINGVPLNTYPQPRLRDCEGIEDVEFEEIEDNQ